MKVHIGASESARVTHQLVHGASALGVVFLESVQSSLELGTLLRNHLPRPRAGTAHPVMLSSTSDFPGDTAVFAASELTFSTWPCTSTPKLLPAARRQVGDSNG